MITEDSVSDNNEKKPLHEEVFQENVSENSTEVNTDSLAETPVEQSPEQPASTNSENSTEQALQEKPEHQADVDTQKSAETAPDSQKLILKKLMKANPMKIIMKKFWNLLHI